MSKLAEIQRKITQAIEDLLTLEVRTVIKDAEYGERRMVTQISLLDGDIETRMHVDFVTGDLDQVRDFHAEQVLKGQTIIAEHVKTLTRLVNELRGRDPAADPETGIVVDAEEIG